MTLSRLGIEVSWPFSFVVFGVALVLIRIGVACYKGDPGYGGPDYPPDPPFKTADAGPG